MKRKVLALSLLSLGLTLTAFAYNQAPTATCCQQKAACCDKATCCDHSKCCDKAACCEKTPKPSCCDGNKPAAAPSQTSRP